MALKQQPDYVDLAHAGMAAVLEALTEASEALATGGDDALEITRQLTELARDEAIRLIRLGSSEEVFESTSEFTRFILGPAHQRLMEHDPEAGELLAGSFSVLSGAVSNYSPGAELAVLRSWNGRGLELLEMLWSEPTRALDRSTILERMGLEGSHLSHMLADLEEAGLIERVKTGRNVKVYLGPVGRTEHVRELAANLASPDDSVLAFDQAIKELALTEDVGSPPGLEDMMEEFKSFREWADDATIGVVDAISGSRICWFIHYEGRVRNREGSQVVLIRQAWRGFLAEDGSMSAALYSATIEQQIRERVYSSKLWRSRNPSISNAPLAMVGAGKSRRNEIHVELEKEGIMTVWRKDESVGGSTTNTIDLVSNAFGSYLDITEEKELDVPREVV